MRLCICADPENCTERVPGYVCRKSRVVKSPATPDLAPLRALVEQWKQEQALYPPEGTIAAHAVRMCAKELAICLDQIERAREETTP